MEAENDWEENVTEEEVNEELPVEIFEINYEENENACNEKIFQYVKTCFIEHQHCMALR